MEAMEGYNGNRAQRMDVRPARVERYSSKRKGAKRKKRKTLIEERRWCRAK